MYKYKNPLVRDIIHGWLIAVSGAAIFVAIGEETAWILKFAAMTGAICGLLALYVYIRDRPQK